MTTDKNIQAIVNRLTREVGLDVFLSVKKRHSEKDFLFVENTNMGFCLFYSDKFFLYSPIKRRAFLLHECFHIFQYLKKFPMLLCSSKKRKVFLVQHIITDLYVSKNMRETGYGNAARQIFISQTKNIEKLLNSSSPSERVLRLSLMLSENILFEKNNSQILKKIKSKISFTEFQKINEIVNIILREYKKDDVFRMYAAIINFLFPKLVLCPFDNMIIVQEKKCLK